MATAVGLTAPASCAAMRARVSGFAETRFVARGGTWIVGAEVPAEASCRGLRRLARLAASAVRECFDAEADFRPEEIPVLVGVAEEGRPGRVAGLNGALLPLMEEALGLRLHAASRVISMGRVAGAIGVREAAEIIGGQGFRRVIVAGTDSYLAAATLDAFDGRDRLLTDRNSNGFVPGEASAAVLLGADDGGPGLSIRSLGFALERATIEGDEPLRGEGLAAAYRQALGAAGLGLHEIDWRIADFSGEQYWLKEAALALARVMRVRREFQDIWHPADCVGEIGAAATPCLLGVTYWAARKGYAPGPLVLAQAGNDDGRRAVLVLDARGLV
jgi:3-oxoacyl-[acyl-carrier-protein] synthase-1